MPAMCETPQSLPHHNFKIPYQLSKASKARRATVGYKELVKI